ncbi:MAG: DUF1566 domain-containing protein [Granulosicoccaceae bacterium]
MRAISLGLCCTLATATAWASTVDNLDLQRRANWFGQERTYELHGEQLVADLGAGLYWQRHAPSQQVSWADAKAYCANLSLSDIDNWRLPSRLELLSLLNYDNPRHAYDSPYFDAEPTVAFWSGTVYDNMPSHVWIAQFGEGDMYCLMRVAQAHVRCVA